MARIFRTETLELDGNLRLASASPDEFLIQSASGSTLMSRATIDSDISSLAAKNVTKDGDISTAKGQDDAVKTSVGTLKTKDTSLDGGISTAKGQDDAVKTSVGTLKTKDTSLDGDISTAKGQDDAVKASVGTLKTKDTSLDGGISTAKGQDDAVKTSVGTLKTKDTSLDGDISTAKGQDDVVKSAVSARNEADIVMDSDISSLAANISSNDIVAKSQSVATDDETKVVAFGRDFGSAPAVLASLKSETADAPVIPAMVTAVTGTQCTVSFGDGIPSGYTYTLQILASAT